MFDKCPADVLRRQYTDPLESEKFFFCSTGSMSNSDLICAARAHHSLEHQYDNLMLPSILSSSISSFGSHANISIGCI